ncbi:serine/threonine protein kinase, CMGC, dual-specificity [Mycoemilia scoparia]|uniref:dual-specificity kinase n=1 Tax=Mycoemilia scoparia TaxID=417184 RepID=A0A9W8A2W0_9FUNG|nr:serine/threonine protein kinase, CMGC, dual-specificity [Mycoemilia scoparia]
MAACINATGFSDPEDEEEYFKVSNSNSRSPLSKNYSPSLIPGPIATVTATLVSSPLSPSKRNSCNKRHSKRMVAVTGEYQRLMASKNNSANLSSSSSGATSNENSRFAASSHLNSNLRSRRKSAMTTTAAGALGNSNASSNSNSGSGADQPSRTYLNRPIGGGDATSGTTGSGTNQRLGHEGYSSVLNPKVPPPKPLRTSISNTSVASNSKPSGNINNNNTSSGVRGANLASTGSGRRLTSAATAGGGTGSGTEGLARTGRRATHVSTTSTRNATGSGPNSRSGSVASNKGGGQNTSSGSGGVTQRRYNPNLRTIVASTSDSGRPSGGNTKMANITYNVNSSAPRTVHAKLEISSSGTAKNTSTVGAYKSKSTPGASTNSNNSSSSGGGGGRSSGTTVSKNKEYRRGSGIVDGVSSKSVAKPPLHPSATGGGGGGASGPSSRRSSIILSTQQQPTRPSMVSSSKVVVDKRSNPLLTSVTAIRTKSSQSQSSSIINGGNERSRLGVSGSSLASGKSSRNSLGQPSPRPPKPVISAAEVSKKIMSASVKPSTSTAYNAALNSAAHAPTSGAEASSRYSIDHLRSDLSNKLNVASSSSGVNSNSSKGSHQGMTVQLSSKGGSTTSVSKPTLGSSFVSSSSGVTSKYVPRNQKQSTSTAIAASSSLTTGVTKAPSNGEIVTGQAVYLPQAPTSSSNSSGGGLGKPAAIRPKGSTGTLASSVGGASNSGVNTNKPPPIPMQTHPMMSMNMQNQPQYANSAATSAGNHRYQPPQKPQQVQIHFPMGNGSNSLPMSAVSDVNVLATSMATSYQHPLPVVSNAIIPPSQKSVQPHMNINVPISAGVSGGAGYPNQIPGSAIMAMNGANVGMLATTSPISPMRPHPLPPQVPVSSKPSASAVPARTPQDVLKHHGNMLTTFERGEILEYPHIYFIGHPKSKPGLAGGNSNGGAQGRGNYGFDDERGDYLVRLNDHLLYRYELTELLGKGSFGQVLKAMDHKTGETKAIKIIRNRKRFHHQALVEVKLLECLRRWDPDNSHCLLQMTDHFYFRNHLCIVTELLSINMYEWLKANQFAGTPNILLKHFTRQILYALGLMSQHRIIHCDLKPENILLRVKPPQVIDHNSNPRSNSAAASYLHSNSGGSHRPAHPLSHNQLVRDIERGLYTIKVIDFGSSCFETERVYTYIQSRFYRSPEVILGHAYATGIDMWSLGCIVAELLTGFPLFPGENEREQLACIMEVLGPPPGYMIERAPRRDEFADDFRKIMNPALATGTAGNISNQQNVYMPNSMGGGFKVGNWVIRAYTNSKGKRRRVGSRPLSQVLARARDPKLVDFVMRALAWDPSVRLTPKEAAMHPWMLEQQQQQAMSGGNAPGAMVGLVPHQMAMMNPQYPQQQQHPQQKVVGLTRNNSMYNPNTTSHALAMKQQQHQQRQQQLGMKR